VLGILFKWKSLAQNISDNTPLTQEENRHSRVCMPETGGTVQADTQGQLLVPKLSFANQPEVWRDPKGYHETTDGSENRWSPTQSLTGLKPTPPAGTR
jgi:hypothetical protein